MRHHGAGILQHLICIPMFKPEHSGGVWVESAHQAGSRGITDGYVAVRLSEGNARLGQARDVWRLRLRMSAKACHVIIQIIANDKEYIWLLGRIGPNGSGPEE